MSIEKIKNSLETTSAQRLFNGQAVKNRVYLGVPHDTTSFSGAAKVVTPAAKPLKEFLLDIMPGKIKKMVKIHEGMGEVQNQLINATGTGLVAPLFIKYNPLSDTDENTRTYTAWRQPVSAVLAVATQAAIVVPFNKIIKHAADIGYFSTRYNSSLFPSDDYLKKEIKALNPGKKYTKQEMKDAIEAHKNANYDKKLINMIEQDKIVFNTSNGKTASTLEMPAQEFKKLFTETIDNIIQSESAEKVKVIQRKLPQKIERGIFFHNNPDEAKSVLQRLRSNVTQIYNQTDFATTPNQIAEANKKFNKDCKALIKELKTEIKKDSSKKSVNTELIKIIKEIKDKNTGNDSSALRVLGEKIDKMIESVNTMQSKKSTQEIMEYVNEVIYRRTNAIDETIEALTKIKTRLETSGITVKEAQQIIDDTIEASRNSVRAKLTDNGIGEADLKKSIEWVESVGTRLSEKAKSISKCIGDQLKKHAKSNIDGLKRWTGLGVSLAILPATCWMLNKIYPWFMDKAFPNLSNKAAAAKEKKNNNQKVEVK
jgi:hypothetical protein